MMDTKSLITEIASQWECGYNCYLDPTSGELISIPSVSGVMDEDAMQDAFAAELKKLEEAPGSFVRFEVPASFEAFAIMERFADQLEEGSLKESLQKALYHRKPFHHFKNIIDRSPMREDWFRFKAKEYRLLVEQQWAAMDGG
ncbi:UPF0158 family protein [Maribacter sp. 2307ULW6-5]|uniref:UPF0158 family protein n=1 Tax=Maribacter sp. 2307ULW6-5 TaxID=3386275 RepID=UPI0039BC64EF